MLQLKIKDFQCWKNLTLAFKIGAVTLIKGISGGGKTTIFNAICWCLFGHTKYVTPNDNPSAKTKVTLQFPYANQSWTIKRSKKPNRVFFYSKKDEKLEDKVAQEKINEMLGDYETWLMTSYIAQKSKSNFFMESNAGKLDFLNSLAFHEDDPKIYIEKIKKIVDQKTAIFDQQRELYKNSCEKYKKPLEICDEINKNQYTENQWEEKNNQREKMVAEKLELKKVIENRQQGIQILSAYEIQLQKVEKNIQNLKKPKSLDSEIIDFIDLTILENNSKNSTLVLAEWEKINKNLYKKEKLQEKITHLNYSQRVSKGSTQRAPFGSNEGKEEDTYQFTMEDYKNVIELETKIQKIKNIIQPMNYSKENILIWIQQSKEKLIMQDNLGIYETFLEQEQKINEYKNMFKKSKDKMEEIKQQNSTISDQAFLLTKKIHGWDMEINTYHQIIKDSQTKKDDLLQKNNTFQKEYELASSTLICPVCDTLLNLENEYEPKLISYQMSMLTHSDITVMKEKIAITKEGIKSIINKIAEQDKNIKHIESIKKKEENILLKSKWQEQENNNKIEGMEKEIKILENGIEVANKNIETFGSNIKKPLGEKLSKKDVHQLNEKIEFLESIEIPIIPQYTSEQINFFLTEKTKVEKYKKLCAKYTIINDKIPSWIPSHVKTNILKSWCGNLEFYDKKMEEYNLSLNLYETQKQELEKLTHEIRNDYGFQSTKNNVQEKLLELEKIEKKITELDEWFSFYKEYQEAVKIKTELQTERIALLAKNKDLSIHYTLQKYAMEAEYTMLESIVSTINISMANMCERIFSKDISGALQLYKETKTTKITKPCVSFKIKLDGKKYDNLSQISGGEIDRISIALSLAFQKVCPFSWLLLLDETLSGLDCESAANTLKAMKENSNSTILVNSQGNVVEGIFDHVINIEDL